jgi:hypothetical protein
MMAFALVAQPLYGFVSAQIVNAATITDHVVINEIMANPTNGQREWVELYNPTNSSVALNNWRIQNGTANFSNIIESGVTIPAKGFIVREATSSSSQLNDTSQLLRLVSDASGTLVDSVTYGGIAVNKTYSRTYDAADTWVAQASSTRGSTNGVAPAVVIVSTPELNAENFNAVGDNYKGISVGFNAKNFGTVTAVTVDVTRADGSHVIKHGNQGVFDLVSNKTTATQLTAPIVIQESVFTEASDIQYWTAAPAVWSENTRPTSVLISVTDENGIKTVTNNTFNDGAPSWPTYASLLPPAPLVDTVAPTITNLKVTNPSLWGDDYNLLTLPNHASTLSGLPTVGGSLSVSANFADNMILTNVISLLPGRGFFSDNETTPFPTNNATWNPVAQGPYSVAWNTKTSADWRSVTDGNYTFTFEARDGGNGQNRPQNSASVPIELTVDNTAPSVSFSGATPAENATVRGDIVVEGNFTDANGLMNTDIGVHAVSWYCHTDWPTAGTKSCTIDTTKLTDGTHQLTMSVRDKAGNTTQVFRTIKVDNTSPSVPVNGLPRAAYELDNDFYFTWANSTDDQSSPVTYEFQSSLNPAQSSGVLTSGLWQSGTLNEAKIHSTGAPDGTWYWQVRAIDAAGNKSAWGPVWNMTIDHVTPTVGLVSPASDTTVNGASLTQSWTSPDADINHYEYVSYNNSAMTQVRFAQNMGLQTSKTATNVGNATFWWRVKAVDNAGHETWSELHKLTVDNDKPTAQLQFNAIGDRSFKVKFNEDVNNDDAENIENYFLHNWPGGGTFDGLINYATATYDPDTTTATVSFTDSHWYLSPEQKWGVRNVRDLAGNVLDETYDYSTPMMNPMVTDVNGVATGKDISWTWTGNDPDSRHNSGATGNSGVKEYRYRVMQGASVIQDWTVASNTAATTTVGDDGLYSLNVRAFDKAGNVSTEVASSAVLVDTIAPELTIGTPLQNLDGTYRVSGTTTDIDQPITVRSNNAIVASNVMADADGTWTIGLGSLIAGDSYVITADTKDAVGNIATQQATTIVVPPVAVLPLTTIAVIAPANLNTPTSLRQPRTNTVASSNGPESTQSAADQDAAVLGIQTTKDDSGVSDLAKNVAAVESSPEGWKFFGVAWYWVVLLIAVIAAIWFAAARRLRQDA